MPALARAVIPLVLLLSAIAACARTAAPLEVGSPAPEFALLDTEGRTHRLSDLRGRVVVLEWTSHICPAVKGHYDDRSIPRTVEALDGQVAWLMIDSGFYVRDLVDDIRTWRAARSIDRPYLLDADGAVGRAYRATVTPQFFVIDASGRVAYIGGLDDRRTGRSERRNHVADAARAVLARAAVATARTDARGCSVKYAADPAASSDPGVLMEWARGMAREGEPGTALAFLGAAIRAGHPAPSTVMADPGFRTVRERAHRARLHALLRDGARESSVSMVAPDEPGERLVVSGVVRDESGRAVPGVRVHAFHTDARGYYSEGGMDENNPRLFAWVLTGDDGRFELRTIRPGHYPDQSEEDPVDQHIHFEMYADGYAEGRGRLGFQDDPFWAARGRTPPRWARPVARDGAVLRCDLELTLRRP